MTALRAGESVGMTAPAPLVIARSTPRALASRREATWQSVLRCQKKRIPTTSLRTGLGMTIPPSWPKSMTPPFTQGRLEGAERPRNDSAGAGDRKKRQALPVSFSIIRRSGVNRRRIAFCPRGAPRLWDAFSELLLAHVSHAGDAQQRADGIDTHTGVEGLGRTLGLVLLGVRGGR